MKTSVIKFKRFVIYGIILCYSASCNFDSLSDLDPGQLVSEETGDQLDQTEAHLRLGSLTFEENFEGEKVFTGQSLQFSGSHSFQIVSDPRNSDNKVGKFELRQNDDIVKSSKRAEIGFRDELREGWYGYSVYFPSTGFEKDSYPEIITQWHQRGGGSPPNSLEVENDKMYFRSINRSDTKDNSNKVYDNYSLGKVQRGKWHEFVFHIVHSPNTDGLIEIWHNNVKVQTIKGPNMRRDFPLPTLKVGIYKWSWAKQKTDTDKRIVYFDNVRVGNEGARLTDFVSGAQGSGEGKVGGIIEEKEEGKQIAEVDVITGFNLVQANIDKDLGSISNGGVVNAATHKLNVTANTITSFKGEIRYKLSGAADHTSVDSNAPFSLFGDNGNGDYFYGSGLYPGTYTLEAAPYQDGEIVGKIAKIKFTISGKSSTESQIVTGFNLIQANTDKDLGRISNGDIVTTSTHKLNIKANTPSSFKGEVRYTLSGASTHTYVDTTAPFTLFGDNGRGDYYYGGGLYPGVYTLTAVPYIDGEIAGKSTQVRFTIKK